MKDITSRRFPRISHGLLAALVLSSQPLLAQDTEADAQTSPAASETPAETSTPKTPTPAESAATAQKPERIEVTGSRIKRTDTETSSAKTTITQEEIERSGVSNLGELIRNSTVQTVGNFGGTSGYVRAGAQTANLFGLGAGRTLVLIDGERLPRDASLGGTNLSDIPIAMIERIEYLTGSRSAVYGSDAVAGVMNIITKKRVEGTTVNTNLRVPQHAGGNKIGLDVTQGAQIGDNAHIVVAGGYEREQRIYSRNRDFGEGIGKFANGIGAVADGQFTYKIRSPGATTAPKWTPSPNCELTSDLRGPTSPDNGVYCVGNNRKNSSGELLGSNERAFITGRGEIDLSDDTVVKTFVTYAQNLARGNSGNYFSGVDYLNSSRYQILSGDQFNALNTGVAIAPGDSVEVRTIDRRAPERINYNRDQAYGGLVSLESKLGSSWSTSATLSHFTSENHRRVNNVIDRRAYAQIMHGYILGPNDTVTGKGDPQYVMLDPNRDPALLAQMTATTKSSEKNSITGITVNASRDIADLPGGKLAINIGVDSRVETYQQVPDPKDTEFFMNQPRFTGTEGVSGKGHREVNSIYAEALAPVLETVDLDAAIRFDNYSDFGNATNFTLGGKWEATQWLSFRTSYGTSYRAPELNYVYKEGGGGYINIRDEAWCDYLETQGSACVEGQTHQIYSESPGNKNLDPERGKTYTLGFTVEPNQDLYISADYAGFYIQDEFSVRPSQDIVDDYFAGRGLGDNRVAVDPTHGYITTLYRPYTNIGWSSQYLVRGELGYKFRFDGYDFNYHTSGVRTLSSKSLRADGSVKQYNGLEGSPRWRWNNSFTTSFKPFSWTVSTMTIARQEPDPENDDVYDWFYFNDQVDEFTQYNTSANWAYSDKGNVTIGVNNVMDKLGGLYRTGNFTGANTINSSLYGSSYYGRSYFMNLSQSF